MFISRELACAACGNIQGHLIDRKNDEEGDYSGEEPCEECGEKDWYRVFSVPQIRTQKLSRTYLDGGIGRGDKNTLDDIRKASRLDKYAANLNKDSTEYKEAKKESKRLRTVKK